MPMKTNGHPTRTERLIARVSASPRYRGKRVIIIHGKAFPSPSGRAGFHTLRSLLKRYPNETPTIVYVPKAETLILHKKCQALRKVEKVPDTSAAYSVDVEDDSLEGLLASAASLEALSA